MNIFVRFPGFKSKALTFSYDDGVMQDKRLIKIMKDHGLKGTFNLNAGLMNDKHSSPENRRMCKEEIIETFRDSGMEVAIHGYRHISLAVADGALAAYDVVTDRRELEKMFGGVIKGMAYANGSYNDSVVEILRQCGIKYARTTISTEHFELPKDWLKLPATCHHNHPRLMELAKAFVEDKPHWYYWARQLKLFYLWGHSYEFDDNDNWNVIEEFAEYIGNREDIWYATNCEIYEYLQAADRLQFSADGSFVKNPSCMDIYIDYVGKRCIVPSGKTVKIESEERV